MPWTEKRQLPIYSYRQHEAREACGISQRNLDIEAGLNEFVASPHVNRYETGVHQPNLQTLRQPEEVLGLPLAYFYAEEDDLARLIKNFKISDRRKR